jgi:hypothetical protein
MHYMRIRNAAVAGFLLLVLTATSIPQANSRSVVLPESAAKDLVHYYSRPGLEHLDGIWMPAEADVKEMESRLPQVSKLREDDEKNGRQIRTPEKYYRQYLGILAGKHKFIYINAFCTDPPPPRWKQRLEEVSDGGACYWNVFYDTVSGEFSNLQINGVA